MTPYTLVAVMCTDGAERIVTCAPNTVVEVIPGHRIFLRDLDGTEYTFNWRHVVFVRRLDLPAKPREGN